MSSDPDLAEYLARVELAQAIAALDAAEAEVVATLVAAYGPTSPGVADSRHPGNTDRTEHDR